MKSRWTSVGGAPAAAARGSHSSAARSSSPRSSGLVRRWASSHALARTRIRVCSRTTSMSVSSARISASTPASKSSIPGRSMIQLSGRSGSGTSCPATGGSGGSETHTGSSRLLPATARASSSRHGREASELGLSTNTNPSERSIPSKADAFQSLAGTTPSPSSVERSSQTSRSRAVRAARSRSTMAWSSRAYDRKTSGIDRSALEILGPLRNSERRGQLRLVPPVPSIRPAPNRPSDLGEVYTRFVKPLRARPKPAGSAGGVRDQLWITARGLGGRPARRDQHGVAGDRDR